MTDLAQLIDTKRLGGNAEKIRRWLLPASIALFAFWASYLIYNAPHFLLSGEQTLEMSERLTLRMDARHLMTEVLGGFAVLIFAVYFAKRRLEIHQQTTDIARDAQVIERISYAIDKLCTYKLEAQLGGIFTLERISQEYVKEHWMIMEILTAYVRENARWAETPARKGGPQHSISKKVAPDVQAILSALGRRGWVAREVEQGNILNLRLSNLAYADLRRANFAYANFRGSSLEKANLAEANLAGAFLGDVNLKGANLARADLRSTNFSHANLEDANLQDADLTGANLHGANLKGATLPPQVNASTATIPTPIPPRISPAQLETMIQPTEHTLQPAFDDISGTEKPPSRTPKFLYRVAGNPRLDHDAPLDTNLNDQDDSRSQDQDRELLPYIGSGKIIQ